MYMCTCVIKKKMVLLRSTSDTLSLAQNEFICKGLVVSLCMDVSEAFFSPTIKAMELT